MTFKQFLYEKGITIYQLSKKTRIPYSTLSDLANGKTLFKNMTLEKAIELCQALNINANALLSFDESIKLAFRYFRSTELHDLKRIGEIAYIQKLIKQRKIEFYQKRNHIEEALYLLALYEYLCHKNSITIDNKKFEKLKNKKLEKPLLPGDDYFTFKTIEEAESKLNIVLIEEFKKYNIIEEDINNVA